MRHYIAMQRDDGKWFYANEGIHRDTGKPGWSPAGACHGGCEGHDTMEEAYEHERQRKLKDARFWEDSEKADTQHLCKVPNCGRFTSGGARVGSYQHFDLCSDHRNIESLDPLYKIGESWES